MRYFDLHCDTITQCALDKKALYNNDLHISIEKAKAFTRWAQFFAVWLPDSIRCGAAVERFESVYSVFCSELRLNDALISSCRSGADMEKAFEDGKNAAFLSIEGGAALSGDIENLFDFYKKGVRMITLTWNGACELGDGCMEPGAGGLTAFGREVVGAMAKLGMVIDVSHLSEQGFYDVAQETSCAFVASHSNARAVCPHKRNLFDWQITEIIRRGGLIGLNLYPNFICEGSEVSFLELLPHAGHILSLGGENVLAVGADFDGADMPCDVKGIEDIDRIGEVFRKTFPETADKIFFQNAYNFFLKL